MNKTHHRIVLPLLAAAAGSMAMLQSGCNIAAGAFYILHGPDQKIEAQYELPPEKATVIFIDDRNSRLPSRDLREMIADAAGQVLMEDGAVKDLIDPRSALGAASKDRFGEPMTISEIGRSVKADIVIYVTVDSFALSADGQTIAPASNLRVKVVDAVTEKRLWPEDKPEGYALGIQSPPRQGTLSNSPAEVFKVRQQAAARAGLGIAQLFSQYIARESATSGSTLGDK
jgi:hypothetical protein